METKQCTYDKCGVEFNTENPKKKFCSLRCKNKAGYSARLNNYGSEIFLQKARMKNINILKDLFNRGFTLVNYDQLKIVGFDFEALSIPHNNVEGLRVFIVGHITLCVVSETEYRISLINKD